MKKLAYCLIAACLSAPAFAASPIDARGYAQCADTLNKEFTNAGLMLDRTYAVKRTPTDRVFYINGFVWQQEIREPLAATCITTRNGRKVLELDAQVGTRIDIEEIAMR